MRYALIPHTIPIMHGPVCAQAYYADLEAGDDCKHDSCHAAQFTALTETNYPEIHKGDKVRIANGTRVVATHSIARVTFHGTVVGSRATIDGMAYVIECDNGELTPVHLVFFEEEVRPESLAETWNRWGGTMGEKLWGNE